MRLKEKIKQHFKISFIYKQPLTLPAWHILWRNVYVMLFSLYQVCIIQGKCWFKIKILLQISNNKSKLLTNKNNYLDPLGKTLVCFFRSSPWHLYVAALGITFTVRKQNRVENMATQKETFSLIALEQSCHQELHQVWGYNLVHKFQVFKFLNFN